MDRVQEINEACSGCRKNSCDIECLCKQKGYLLTELERCMLHCADFKADAEKLGKEVVKLRKVADEVADVLDSIAPNLDKLAEAHGEWLDALRELEPDEQHINGDY